MKTLDSATKMFIASHTNMTQLEKFQNLLDRRVGQILRSPDWPNCAHERCFCLNHSEKLEKLYEKLNAEIIRCGEESFGRRRHRGKEVPGWNENVKQHYAQYREAYHNWRQMGSERQGDSAVQMRVSRARFKLALRWCKRHEEELREKP